MILTYWTNFKKRRNSTLLPASAGSNVNIVLKDLCSILNPSFLISGDTTELARIDYVRWNNRYYFVDNISFVRTNLVQINTSVDVLATYRSEVSNYTAFVERSSSDYDVMLNDGLLSNRLETAVKTTTISSPLPLWYENGSFIIRTVGQASTASSVGITSYACQKGQLLDVLRFLFSDEPFDFLADTSVKAFFNPFQYIVSVDWFPFNPLAFGKTLESVKLGWWNSDVSCVVVEENNIVFTIEMLLPNGVYEDFRKFDSRWTQIKLLLPGCGAIFLNPIDCGENGLEIVYNIDIATGACFVKIFPKNSSFLITTMSGFMSTSIAIGQLQTHEQKTANQVGSAIGDLLRLDIGSLLQRAVDVTLDMAQPTPCINGSAGNMGAILGTPLISASLLQYDGCDYPTSTSGRPLMRNRRLGSLSGYIKCGNASIPISGCIEEKNMLNTLVNGGFYYE